MGDDAIERAKAKAQGIDVDQWLNPGEPLINDTRRARGDLVDNGKNIISAWSLKVLLAEDLLDDSQLYAAEQMKDLHESAFKALYDHKHSNVIVGNGGVPSDNGGPLDLYMGITRRLTPRQFSIVKNICIKRELEEEDFAWIRIFNIDVRFTFDQINKIIPEVKIAIRPKKSN